MKKLFFICLILVSVTALAKSYKWYVTYPDVCVKVSQPDFEEHELTKGLPVIIMAVVCTNSRGQQRSFKTIVDMDTTMDKFEKRFKPIKFIMRPKPTMDLHVSRIEWFK